MGWLDRWLNGPRRDETRSSELGLRHEDLLTLNALRDHGADLDEPRHVLHHLFFPTEEAALDAAGDVARHHWDTEVRDPLPGSTRWGLVCERSAAVLTPDFVRNATDLFEKVARRWGGEHDGWEAST